MPHAGASREDGGRKSSSYVLETPKSFWTLSVLAHLDYSYPPIQNGARFCFRSPYAPACEIDFQWQNEESEMLAFSPWSFPRRPFALSISFFVSALVLIAFAPPIARAGPVPARQDTTQKQGNSPTETPPAAQPTPSLLISPNNFAILVGSPQEMRLTDQTGRPIQGAAWSIANPAIADLAQAMASPLSAYRRGEQRSPPPGTANRSRRKFTYSAPLRPISSRPIGPPRTSPN